MDFMGETSDMGNDVEVEEESVLGFRNKIYLMALHASPVLKLSHFHYTQRISLGSFGLNWEN